MGLFDSLSDGLKNALGQAEAAAMTRGHAPFHGAHPFPIFTRLLTAPRRAVSTSPRAGITEWRILGEHDDLANRPERYAGKL